MSGLGRKITTVAVSLALCTVPTVAIGAAPASKAAAAPVSAATPSSQWLTLSAMTSSSSSAAATAAAAQGEEGAGFPPIVPLAIILATIALGIYLLVDDDDGSLDFDPVSPN